MTGTADLELDRAVPYEAEMKEARRTAGHPDRSSRPDSPLQHGPEAGGDGHGDHGGAGQD